MVMSVTVMSLGTFFFPSDSFCAGVSPLQSNFESDIYSTHSPVLSIAHILPARRGKVFLKAHPWPGWHHGLWLGSHNTECLLVETCGTTALRCCLLAYISKVAANVAKQLHI